MVSPYVTQVLGMFCINAILALGAALPLACGRLVVAFGALSGVGGLAAAVVFAQGVLPFCGALLVGSVVGSLAAVLVGVVAAGTRGFVFAVVTLSCGEIIRVAILNAEWCGGPLGFSRVVPVTGLGYPVGALMLVAVGLQVASATRLRSSLFAVQFDATWASTLGIRAHVQEFWALVIGGAIAGLGGGLYAHNVGILEPRVYGVGRSLEILMYPIIGGVSRTWGPVVGAALLTFGMEVLRVSHGLRMLLYGVAVVVVSVSYPDGIARLARTCRKGAGQATGA